MKYEQQYANLHLYIVAKHYAMLLIIVIEDLQKMRYLYNVYVWKLECTSSDVQFEFINDMYTWQCDYIGTASFSIKGTLMRKICFGGFSYQHKFRRLHHVLTYRKVNFKVIKCIKGNWLFFHNRSMLHFCNFPFFICLMTFIHKNFCIIVFRGEGITF